LPAVAVAEDILVVVVPAVVFYRVRLRHYLVLHIPSPSGVAVVQVPILFMVEELGQIR
jgi:hypothetical protein